MPLALGPHNNKIHTGNPFFNPNGSGPGDLTTDIAAENSIQNVLQLHYFLCTCYNSRREKVKKIQVSLTRHLEFSAIWVFTKWFRNEVSFSF